MNVKSRKLIRSAATLACLGLAGAALAERSNPYESIVTRNVFGLRPPPPPQAEQPAAAPIVPPATVKLTGIHNLFNKAKALLEIVPGPGKQPVKPILEEGERFEGVEVISIDIANNKVLIRNSGLETNITFEVAKSSGPAPGAPAPGFPGGVPPGMVAPPPPAAVPTLINPSANATSGSGRSSIVLSGAAPATGGNPGVNALGGIPFGGNRSINTPGVVGTVYGGAGATVPGGASGSDPFRSIPSRPLRAPNQNTGAPMSREESYINLGIEKLKHPQLPLPPIPGLDQ